jgi:hypothetical protein
MQILCPATFSENRSVNEKISKNRVEPERLQEIWGMRVACWISKAKRAQAHARVRAPTPKPTNSRTHKHVLTEWRARAHTHTQKYVMF